MGLLSLILREIAWRKLNSALAALAVAVAVGVLVGSMTLLAAREAQSKKELAKLEDDYRRITLKLGFNVLILPKDQDLSDLYAQDYAAKTMPEDYASRLAKSRVMTVNHLLPVLQQKVKWAERERTILLVGTRGEVPVVAGDARQPLQSAVKPGTIVLGHELWKSTGLKEGDRVALMGREFTVAKCHDERGTKDDITAWIDLAESQALLKKEGLINAIMAIGCECAGDRLATIRKEIERVLPNTQVIEFASQAVTRAEARERAKEHAATTLAAQARFFAVLVAVAIVGAAAWVGFLAFQNVRERRGEIGILRALGMRASGVLLVFLGKAVVTGVAGTVLGTLAGLAIAPRLAAAAPPAQVLLGAQTLLVILFCAPVLSALAAWLPAYAASRQDPAVTLSEA